MSSIISQTAPVPPVTVTAFQPVRPLPAVQFQVERANFEHSVPMYGPELVATISGISQPSDNLLHHCYAHLYLKVSAALFYIYIQDCLRKLEYCDKVLYFL